ncbi:hypothetical protein EV580_1562 [Mycobacterium sp. BK086]|nr:hypothetical protein EV580_1562 [Mycobacterium sp. BK086]
MLGLVLPLALPLGSQRNSAVACALSETTEEVPRSMHRANDAGVLSDRLRDLVGAEAAMKAGNISRDPNVASMTLNELQREIHETAMALAAALGEDAAAGDALANAVREEIRLATSPTKPKNYVVTDSAKIAGELHRQAVGAWFATGFFLLGTVLSLVNHEWAVASALAAVALLCVLRTRVGITRLRVDRPSGQIFLRHRARWEPIDFAQYSHARGLYAGWPIRVPSVIVVQRRPVYRYTTGTVHRLFPHRTRKRMVFLINSCWRTEEGHLVAAYAMDDLIENACRRAGFRIERIKSGLAGLPGWLGKRR